VASLFISRWDVAVTGKVPAELNNRLGIAVAKRTYKAYRDLLTSPRWMCAYNAGARPQRLLWASTGTPTGVETTTGPLGQGVATSVGMAIAEAWLADRYNRPGFEIFGYNIYAVCGDGCMMEGVGSEAASLAGHLALDNLCWIYDNNHITIEGNTRITFTEDIAARFLGYGWNVLRVGDANDTDRIEHALDVFHETKDRPTFIILDSHIGYGSPHKQDDDVARPRLASAH
jgi:transketolase